MTHQLLREKRDIIDWLKKYNIKDYFLEDTPEYGYTVSVYSSVKIGHAALKSIDVKFLLVHGDFVCNYNQLTSLKGCPDYVKGNFLCDANELEDLKYCPKKILGNFSAVNAGIRSLKYLPKVVEKNIHFEQNKFENLDTLILPESVGGSISFANDTLPPHLQFFENFTKLKNTIEALNESKQLQKLIERVGIEKSVNKL